MTSQGKIDVAKILQKQNLRAPKKFETLQFGILFSMKFSLNPVLSFFLLMKNVSDNLQVLKDDEQEFPPLPQSHAVKKSSNCI